MNLLIISAITAVVVYVLYKLLLMKKFDFIAPYYDAYLHSVEQQYFVPARKRFVPLVEGKVLDLAVGTGPNISFYPYDKITDVTLIDLSSPMLYRAKLKSSLIDVEKAQKLHFAVCPCENLPFEANTFDTVLSIDVLCSVDDLEQSIEEAYRVLKPNGTAIFVEHFRTGDFWRDLWLGIQTIYFKIVLGSSMIRKTDEALNNSKFKVLENGMLAKEVGLQYFICKKEVTASVA
ncbi:hypothetical protein ABK040_000369 [Willaertia magna]